jgi:hypothetical protein
VVELVVQLRASPSAEPVVPAAAARAELADVLDSHGVVLTRLHPGVPDPGLASRGYPRPTR